MINFISKGVIQFLLPDYFRNNFASSLSGEIKFYYNDYFSSRKITDIKDYNEVIM